MDTKEKIFTDLKAGMGNTSLSDKTLQGIADGFATFYKADTEVTPDVMKNIISYAKTQEGQLSHDIAAQVNAAKTKFETDFKVQWEKEHPTPDPKKIIDDKKKPAPVKEDENKSEIEKQLNELKEFKEQYMKEKAKGEEEMKKQTLQDAVKKQLIEQGCKENTCLKYAMTNLDFSKDEKANAEAIKTIYDKEMEEMKNATGFIPRTGGNIVVSNNDEQKKAAIKAQFDELKKKHQI